MEFIADASFIVGPWSKTPARQRWVREFMEEHKPPFITSEPAFTEAAHLMDNHKRVSELMQSFDYQFAGILNDEQEAVARLLAKYAPEMDLADATLVLLSGLYPGTKVLTTDKTHFSFYRRLDGKPVPAIFMA